MSKPKAPPPPDYTGAAVAQGAANIDAARATAKLSNPNIVSPYGTQTVQYGVNGDQDQARVTQTLSPTEQGIYEQDARTRGLLGGLGEQGARSLEGVVGRNLDLSGAPGAPGGADATRQKVIDAMMRRSDIRLGQQNEQQNSDLIAAGIRPGTEAYRRVQEQQGQNRNDAISQAELAAGQEAQRSFGMDTDARKNAIAEILAQRQTPLNEISALMSGSQVGNPFAGNLGYQAGATVGAAPIANATAQQGAYDQNAYAQRVGGYNSTMSGLFGLGSAGVGAFSDRRLKKNIIRIGTHHLGIGLYRWDYIWDEPMVGVMADEVEQVMPEAIGNVGGYKTVNYAMIGA